MRFALGDHSRVGGAEVFNDGGGSIRGTIVHDADFPVDAEGRQERPKLLDRRADANGLVECRDDDGQVWRGHGTAASTS